MFNYKYVTGMNFSKQIIYYFVHITMIFDREKFLLLSEMFVELECLHSIHYNKVKEIRC